jgi:hypothetical protein
MFPKFVIYFSVQDKSNRIVPMNKEIATQLRYTHKGVNSNTSSSLGVTTSIFERFDLLNI